MLARSPVEGRLVKAGRPTGPTGRPAIHSRRFPLHEHAVASPNHFRQKVPPQHDRHGSGARAPSRAIRFRERIDPFSSTSPRRDRFISVVMLSRSRLVRRDARPRPRATLVLAARRGPPADTLADVPDSGPCMSSSNVALPRGGCQYDLTAKLRTRRARTAVRDLARRFLRETLSRMHKSVSVTEPRPGRYCKFEYSTTTTRGCRQ